MVERDPNNDPEEADGETPESASEQKAEPDQERDQAPEPAEEPTAEPDEERDQTPEPAEEPTGEPDEAEEQAPEPMEEPEEAIAKAPERAARGDRRGDRRSSRAPEVAQTRIAFIGGTGPEGLGLAMRFARSGNMVFIGSRTEERAEEAVAKVKEKIPEGDVFGGLNLEGAEKADIVFITVPSDAHESMLTDLAEAIGEKILVDVVVPMVWEKDGPRAVDLEEGSAAEQARRIVPEAKVISGFHHLDASELQRVDKPMQGDVIVCGDHKQAKKQVLDLVEQIEWVRALDGGPLANARYLENWTVVLLHLNKIYKAHSGIRVTGI